jgi:hypothetical protein
MTNERSVADWTLSQELVDRFVAGKATETEEAALADEVSQIMPFHAEMPNPLVAAVKKVMDRLGGEPQLWAWLDRHPGRPRKTARLYLVMSLLDRISTEPAVVTALTEYRSHTPYPPGLEEYLPPATSGETLADLSGEIELLLRQDRVDTAVALAASAVDLLGELAPRIAEQNPDLRELGDQVTDLRKDLTQATAG